MPLLLSLLAPQSASASDFDWNGDWISLGPSVGTHLHEAEIAPLVGAELTLVRIKDSNWMGLMLDGRLVAADSRSGLFSLGAQAGIGPCGINVAPVLVFAGDGVSVAGQASLSLSFLIAHLSLRAGYGPTYGEFRELAAQLKWPLQLR